MGARVFITGVSGYVGAAAAARARDAGYDVIGTVHHTPPASPEGPTLPLDLRDAAAVSAALARWRPQVIVHAAAAWRTPEEAQAVIVGGAQAVANAAAALGARLIHLSTDLVFDGEHAPYVESDPPAPVNFYGAAKQQAEQIVQAALADHVIVRTSLVTCFDPPDPRTAPILAALRGSGPPVTLFTDEFRCPIRRADLAAALVELLAHPYRGILHIAGPQRLSRYELGLAVARHWGLPPNGIQPGLGARSSLPRPRDCTLDTTRAQRILRTNLLPVGRFEI